VATFAGLDLGQIKKLLSSGHTEKFVQDFFEIPACTWSEWKRKNPAFKQMIVDWKRDADDAVQHALFQAAIGETLSEVVHFRNKKTYDVTPYENTKQLPKNVTAAIHWLKKRNAEEWGDEPVKNPLEGIFAGANLTVQQQDLDDRIKQIKFGDALEAALR
jgi:hypothetical protein